MAKKKLSSKSNYVPKYMVQSVEVENKGKTTDIDGADIYDGFYVKKGVKFGNGGGTAISSENGGYAVGTNADFNSNQYQPDVDLQLMKRGGGVGNKMDKYISDLAKKNTQEFSVNSFHKFRNNKFDIGVAKNYFSDTDYNFSEFDKKLGELLNVDWESQDKYAKGGSLKKKANYVPNYMVQSVEVERKGKTTDIDGADIYDGFYVKKGVKFAKGSTVGSKVGKAKNKKQKAIDLLVKHIKYNFVNTDMGSGWKFVLYAPFSTSGYGQDILEEMRYLDIFDAEGIDDWDELSKEDKKYYYDEWKEDMWQSSFEQFKELVIPEYLHFFEEELQSDKKALGGFLAGVGVGVAGKWAYDKYGKKLQGKGTKKVASKGKKRKYEEGGKISNWGGTAESSQEGMLIGGTNAELTSNQYGSGGKITSADEGTGSSSLREKAQEKIDKGMTVIDFSYTDYGGSFGDKVAIAYFKKHHPKNILVENSAYNGQNAFVFGKVADEYLEAIKDYPLGFEDMESFYYDMQNDLEAKEFKWFVKELKSDGYKVSPKTLDWLMENKSGYYRVEPNMLDYSPETLTEELIEEGLVSKKMEDGGMLSSWSYSIGGL